MDKREFVVKDSGKRDEFETGCVRDVVLGKGRFDLVGSQGLIRIISLLQDGQKRLDHIGMEGFFRLAKWYEAGANKYRDRNWELGMKTGRCYNSAMRHLMKYGAGWKDEDHLAACAWNIFAIMEYETTLPEQQDLPHRLDGISWEKKTSTEWNHADDRRLLVTEYENEIIFNKTTSFYFDSVFFSLSLYMAGWRDWDYLASAAIELMMMMEIEKRHPERQDMKYQLDPKDYAEE